MKLQISIASACCRQTKLIIHSYNVNNATRILQSASHRTVTEAAWSIVIMHEQLPLSNFT